MAKGSERDEQYEDGVVGEPRYRGERPRRRRMRALARMRAITDSRSASQTGVC